MTKTIYIAEDELFICKLCKAQMEESINAEVRCAKNGKDLLALIAKKEPDLLLLDLIMPIIDGFEVLETLKKKEYTFPIVVLTNLGQEEDKKRCLDLGANEYYIKSEIELHDLNALLQKYL